MSTVKSKLVATVRMSDTVHEHVVVSGIATIVLDRTHSGFCGTSARSSAVDATFLAWCWPT